MMPCLQSSGQNGVKKLYFFGYELDCVQIRPRERSFIDSYLCSRTAALLCGLCSSFSSDRLFSVSARILSTA